VYSAAFELQQRVYEISNGFPKVEAYSLTDQVRRSSRSIGANLAEAWQKRRYEAHFVAKLTDADGEQAETRHWLATALACGYISPEGCSQLDEECKDFGELSRAARATSISAEICEERATPSGGKRTAAQGVAPKTAWGFVAPSVEYRQGYTPSSRGSTELAEVLVPGRFGRNECPPIRGTRH